MSATTVHSMNIVKLKPNHRVASVLRCFVGKRLTLADIKRAFPKCHVHSEFAETLESGIEEVKKFEDDIIIAAYKLEAEIPKSDVPWKCPGDDCPWTFLVVFLEGSSSIFHYGNDASDVVEEVEVVFSESFSL